MAEILPEQGAAMRWLRALTDAQQALVAELFGAAIAEDCATPNAVCRHAVQSLRLQIDEADASARPRLRRVESHLCSHTTGALAFAQDRITWAALPEAEKERLRTESADRYREQLRANAKARHAAIAQGGSHG